MKKIDSTHEKARELVEFYLKAKCRKIMADNSFTYPPQFIERYKLEKRFCGHSYDILTDEEIVEIDDYGKHSKTNQKINDGIAKEYAAQYLSYKFYRLIKEEIVDSKGYLQPTAAEYLRKNLF